MPHEKPKPPRPKPDDCCDRLIKLLTHMDTHLSAIQDHLMSIASTNRSIAESLNTIAKNSSPPNTDSDAVVVTAVIGEEKAGE